MNSYIFKATVATKYLTNLGDIYIKSVYCGISPSDRSPFLIKLVIITNYFEWKCLFVDSY